MLSFFQKNECDQDLTIRHEYDLYYNENNNVIIQQRTIIYIPARKTKKYTCLEAFFSSAKVFQTILIRSV